MGSKQAPLVPEFYTTTHLTDKQFQHTRLRATNAKEKTKKREQAAATAALLHGQLSCKDCGCHLQKGKDTYPVIQ